MIENDGHALIDVPYQGNGTWLVSALFLAFAVYYAISQTRSKRKAGFPVNIRGVIWVCIVASTMVVVSVVQVMTHEW